MSAYWLVHFRVRHVRLRPCEQNLMISSLVMPFSNFGYPFYAELVPSAFWFTDNKRALVHNATVPHVKSYRKHAKNVFMVSTNCSMILSSHQIAVKLDKKKSGQVTVIRWKVHELGKRFFFHSFLISDLISILDTHTRRITHLDMCAACFWYQRRDLFLSKTVSMIFWRNFFLMTKFRVNVTYKSWAHFLKAWGAEWFNSNWS